MRVRASLLLPFAAAGVAVAAPAPASSPGPAAAPVAARAPVTAPALVSAPVSATAVRRRPRPHRLAVLGRAVSLSDRPRGRARVQVGSVTEFGSPQVLGVAARRGDWLGVVTTSRPNNRLAWVRRDAPGLRVRRTRWSLHADLSERTLTLRKGRRGVRRMKVAIGRP